MHVTSRCSFENDQEVFPGITLPNQILARLIGNHTRRRQQGRLKLASEVRKRGRAFCEDVERLTHFLGRHHRATVGTSVSPEPYRREEEARNRSGDDGGVVGQKVGCTDSAEYRA